MSTVCLSFHAGYSCQNSGACCTSGWAIPVERPRKARIDQALAAGRLRLPPGAEKPWAEGQELPDGSSILHVRAGGACACYDAGRRRCAVHVALGHDALPVACQHFPRVCLVDRDGTFVTLSHYCPTAARLLVVPAKLELCPTPPSDERTSRIRQRPHAAERRIHVRPHATGNTAHAAGTIAIVDAPADFAPMALEGLDAREALPPLLHPRMLGDRGSYRRWERWVVATLCEDVAAEAALSRIVDVTEAIRGWEPRQGDLGAAMDEAFASAWSRESPATPALTAASLALDAAARRAVPEGLTARPVPAAVEEAHRALVAPAWPAFAAPVRRYLAARAFANWCAYQGRGLRTVVHSVVAALSVLRVEAARHCEAAGRTLDEALLVEAFRSSDLLLVHLASGEDLARRLGAIEQAEAADVREAVGPAIPAAAPGRTRA